MKKCPEKLDITHPQVVEYLQRLCDSGDPVLHEMEEYAHRLEFPIVGPLVGRFLAQLVILTQPKVFVEMGSGFGYSAYGMAKAA